ncbi:MAG: pyrimidine dimer DNA glycosylase [Anaerolineae bacterium]|nr:pyrimidine dimer DNA glycosylase [Anaerolineae bacterium]
MRIWDIPPEKLCRNHLLGEHAELHAIWTILTEDRQGGYANHPEVERWRGKLKALYSKHEEIVREMLARGYRHNSPLDPELATGAEVQDTFVDLPEEQARFLRKKGCDCQV